MAYADTILTLDTDRGALALSAYKVKTLRQLDDDTTEITYAAGDADTAWASRAIVRRSFTDLYDTWMRALRAWDGN